ncbi:hypothetical protein F5884DRAFT_808805 [Xylogone sp. PMI_703]|nr:hypothetical protein F5884DRAFT_808805 [Xylogone sp. PMI_703]
MSTLWKWFHRVNLILFFIVSILCLVFSFIILFEPSYGKSGIFTAFFDLPNVHVRGVSLSIPTNLNELPPAASVLNEAQSVASLVATRASGFVSEAGSAVTSITTAIPKRCTLGTKEFCIGFADDAKCRPLPGNLSSLLPASIIQNAKVANIAGIINDINKALDGINPIRITDFFVIASTFAIFSMFPDIILICPYLLPVLAFNMWMPLILTSLRVVFSFACLISTLLPTLILHSMQHIATDLSNISQ